MAMSENEETNETRWPVWKIKEGIDLQKELDRVNAENSHLWVTSEPIINHLASGAIGKDSRTLVLVRLDKAAQIIRALIAGNPFVFDTEGFRQDVHEAARAWLEESWS